MLGGKYSGFLRVAIEENDRALVRHLLAYGVDPNDIEADEKKWTGRPMLVFAKSESMVQLLQEYGASITVTDNKHSTLLHYACYSYYPCSLAAHYINEFKKLNVLKNYINNQTGPNRLTPLHQIIFSAFIDKEDDFKKHFPEIEKKVTLLLENGADCLRQNALGQTPQDKIDDIVRNASRWKCEWVVPFWAKITAQLAPVMKVQAEAQDAKRAQIIKEQISCAICIEDFQDSEDESDKRTALPCGHVFHAECLKAWFKTSRTCPTCRVSVIEENNNNNNGQ